MSKRSLSTFEREMQDDKFRESFKKGYREFLLSEVILSLMEESHKTGCYHRSQPKSPSKQCSPYG